MVVKEVVRIVQNPEYEITVGDARKEKPDIKVGDDFKIDLKTDGLGRIAAQMAKQVIIQRVREAERANIYAEFKSREGELITGSVSQVERGNIYIDIGRAEAILPRREQIFREVYKRGDRIRAYILEVREATKGPQIVASRTHPGLLIRLFEMEVPEIYDGVVEIKGCVREPSGRSKVAVQSNDRDIDPVGACVGTRGSRVQAIVQELYGEKIDIISWSDDTRTFAGNALSPAKIQHITLHEEEGRMEVLVPDVAPGRSELLDWPTENVVAPAGRRAAVPRVSSRLNLAASVLAGRAFGATAGRPVEPRRLPARSASCRLKLATGRVF